MEYNMGPGRENAALEQRYKDAEVASKQLAAQFRAIGHPSFDEFEGFIHDYVRIRMLLEPEDELVDSLNALGQMNLARALGVDLPDLAKIDMEAKCGGTSAVMTKKILLIIALKRDLDVDLSADEAAEITKLSQLIARMYKLYAA